MESPVQLLGMRKDLRSSADTRLPLRAHPSFPVAFQNPLRNGESQFGAELLRKETVRPPDPYHELGRMFEAKPPLARNFLECPQIRCGEHDLRRAEEKPRRPTHLCPRNDLQGEDDLPHRLQLLIGSDLRPSEVGRLASQPPLDDQPVAIQAKKAMDRLGGSGDGT